MLLAMSRLLNPAVLSLIALPLLGCEGSGLLGQIQTVDDLRDICDQEAPDEVEFDLFFERTQGCNWGEDGNGEAASGSVTARSEQTVSIDIPAGGVVCGLDFDFAGLDPSFQQEMTYDDHFMLNFNGIVLAASYGEMITYFDTLDGLALYDWEELHEFPIEEHGEIDGYCVGEDEGLSNCTIPESETPGPISLAFGGDLVDRMSFLALESGEYSFQFITTGDDNDSDCYHEDFEFTVAAPVIGG
jgi:hypothetical protein